MFADILYYLSGDLKKDCSHRLVLIHSSRIRMRRSGSIEVDSSVKAAFHEDQPEAGTSENMGIKKETALNPWVLKCHRTQLQELMAHMYADSSEPSILLLNSRNKQVSVNIFET